MRKNRLIWILMISTLVFCLVSLVPTVFAAPKVKIVVWTWSQEQAGFFSEMEKRFEQANPGIDVQYVNTAQAQYRNSLPLAFRSGNAPDIFFESNQPAQIVDQGFARPLNEFITPEFLNKFPEEYFFEGVCKSDGKIYALPQSNYKVPRPIYFYYNKTVMKEAGLDPNKPPKTWSELREMAKKITVAGKGRFYGLAMVGKPAHDVNRVLQSFSSTLGLQENSFDWRAGKFM
ncbi:MAG: extracellular solute-binding protein, partial [Firmicutes bacterium]|nr:extracellular solute-binding protein [Bacillota bacterium]